MHIAILTTTRADWGKLFPYAEYLAKHAAVTHTTILCTGQHLDKRYGLTELEVYRQTQGLPHLDIVAGPEDFRRHGEDGGCSARTVPSGASRPHLSTPTPAFANPDPQKARVFDVSQRGVSEPQPQMGTADPTEVGTVDRTVAVLRWVHQTLAQWGHQTPDWLVVHGDRMEACAGALAALYTGVRIVHVEGGEYSGNIDGTLRHVISRLAHVHWATTEQAANRLLGWGEQEVWVTGHMHLLNTWGGSVDPSNVCERGLPLGYLNPNSEVFTRYAIPAAFARYSYAVMVVHPTWPDTDEATVCVESCLEACHRLALPVVALYPNDEPGSAAILDLYHLALDSGRALRLVPSMRPGSYLDLVRGARVLVGNSSSTIHEAPYLGTPSVVVGTRQSGRATPTSTLQVLERPTLDDVTRAIGRSLARPRPQPVSTADSLDRMRRACDRLCTGPLPPLIKWSNLA